jgi:hypothetical protein
MQSYYSSYHRSHGVSVLLHVTEMQVLCAREVRFWKLLRPCAVDESAVCCMQLRIDYLQGSSSTSLLVKRVTPWSAAVRPTELFTKLLQALPDTFEHADLLQCLPGELAGSHYLSSDVSKQIMLLVCLSKSFVLSIMSAEGFTALIATLLMLSQSLTVQVSWMTSKLIQDDFGMSNWSKRAVSCHKSHYAVQRVGSSCTKL